MRQLAWLDDYVHYWKFANNDGVFDGQNHFLDKAMVLQLEIAPENQMIVQVPIYRRFGQSSKKVVIEVID